MPISVSKPFSEYPVDFTSVQLIHTIRRKLQYALSIIENTNQTVKSMTMHEEALAKLAHLHQICRVQFRCEINNMSGDLSNYKHTAHRLIGFCNDIQTMVEYLQGATSTGASRCWCFTHSILIFLCFGDKRPLCTTRWGSPKLYSPSHSRLLLWCQSLARLTTILERWGLWWWWHFSISPPI